VQLRKSAQNALKVAQVLIVLSAIIVLITRNQTNVYSYRTASNVWMARSAEFRALCHQAFNAAKVQVDKVVSKRHHKIPLAIICDIDSTILDATPYIAKLIKKERAYPYKWSDWVHKAKAKALPGAQQFLKYVAKQGIEIFYVTRRSIIFKSSTVKNLKAAGFPVKNNHVLCSTPSISKKDHRRIINQEYRVAVLIGDQLQDLDDKFCKENIKIINDTVTKQKELFGKRFIMLPNPTYGHWMSLLPGNHNAPEQVILTNLKGLVQPYD
jgi:5'-nucleotidase (lipoprotein e(P4) family)